MRCALRVTNCRCFGTEGVPGYEEFWSLRMNRWYRPNPLALGDLPIAALIGWNPLKSL